MRTHIQIIKEQGGYRPFAAKLAEAGHTVTPEQARFWERREAIPPEHWRAVASMGWSTLDELVEATERRREAKASAQEAAA